VNGSFYMDPKHRVFRDELSLTEGLNDVNVYTTLFITKHRDSHQIKVEYIIYSSLAALAQAGVR